MFITSPNPIPNHSPEHLQAADCKQEKPAYRKKRASYTCYSSFYSGHKEQYDALWAWRLDMSLLRPAATAPHRNKVNIAHCVLSVKFLREKKKILWIWPLFADPLGASFLVPCHEFRVHTALFTLKKMFYTAMWKELETSTLNTYCILCP